MSTHRIRCNACGDMWDQPYKGVLPDNWRETVQFQCACLGDPKFLDVVVTLRSSVRIRHGMRGDMQDYREDLARFPNDPEAFVDGPRALEKLKDKRKRAGWQLRPLDNAAPSDNGGVNLDPNRSLAAEAYEEAAKNNFKLEGE